MSSPVFAAGSIVAGRYRVIRALGHGGMGTVLEVSHVQLGGRFALKLLHGEHATDPEMVARFENEARLAATLRSEHVVRVTDMGRIQSGEPYLVMDYLQGSDLDQLLETHGRFPIATAVGWTLEACVGLAHLHAAGSVHRDIKPSNLFWATEADGRQLIKVLDFGLAKAPSSGHRLTSTSASFGTPQFMAPEQIMSAKHVDARCDQHALALVLYELLTGEPAFQGETAGAITVAIATHPAPAPSRKRPEVPPGLDEVVLRALAKRPADRFPSLAELAVALAPFGGASAPELARATVKVLTSTPVSTDPLRPSALAASVSSIGSDTTLDAPTIIRKPEMSTTGLTSSTRPARARAQPLWLPVALVLGAGAVGGLWWGATQRQSALPAASEEGGALAPMSAPSSTASTPAGALVTPQVGVVDPPAVVASSSSAGSASASPAAPALASADPPSTARPSAGPASPRPSASNATTRPSATAPPPRPTAVDPLNDYQPR